MNYVVHSPKKHSVTIDQRTEFSRPFEILVGKSKYSVAIRKYTSDGRIQSLMIDHKVYPIEVERRGDGMPVKVILKGVPYGVEISKMASTRFRPAAAEREVSGKVLASLPGQIVRMRVKVGDKITMGQPLFVLDAMKMENEIASPRAGTIKAIMAEKGRIVAKGDLILEIAD